MEKLFAVFIIVALLALMIVPLLAVKNIDKTHDVMYGTGKGKKRFSRRRKNKDTVKPKIAGVRKTSDGTTLDNTIYRGTVEFVDGNISRKAVVIDEAIDSFIVSGNPKGNESGGFDYPTTNTSYAPDCRYVKKSAVTAYYKDYTEYQYSYKGQPVQFIERNGKTYIEAYEVSSDIRSEFTAMELGSHGNNYTKYRKDIAPDDPGLVREEAEHYHEDLTVDTYGLYEGMDKAEYDEALIGYLAKKINTTPLAKEAGIRKLIIGAYGYRFPCENFYTDPEVVMGRIIPLSYGRPDINKKTFNRELISSIIYSHRGPHIRRGILCVSEYGVDVFSKEYSYYMCLVYHLLLMKYHKSGKKPYISLDLSNVWHWLEDEANREKVLEKHVPVYYRDKLICEDLAEFTAEAFKELVYFKQFEKEKIAKSAKE